MADNPAHGVLVVEDDLAIRRLVIKVLQREGYRVDAAADGLEAVGKLKIKDFDVIVLDLMMPHLDGFTILTNFASDPDRLRRVIVTSAASPAVIRERMPVNPFAVLPKPFDIADLMMQVRACIDCRSPNVH